MRSRALLVALALLVVPASAHAAFPGSNGKIAFSREAQPGGSSPTQIWAVDPSGVGPVSLASSSDVDFGMATWSPSGTRIAMEGQDTSGVHIYVMNADGSGRRQVTLGGGEDSPSWAPDGRHLVFSSSGLATVDVDGGPAQTPIPGTTTRDTNPAWSPDGTTIAFTHYNGTLYQLGVIPAGGGAIKILDTAPQNLWDIDAAWSPDGSTIYFTRGSIPVGCEAPGTRIYSVPAAGGTAKLWTPGATDDYDPAPSPDGTSVAFTRCDDRADDIDHVWIANADGSSARPLTSGNGNSDEEPDWQPAAPQFASAPSIGGRAVNNQTLTATAGSSPGGGSTTLQFERCDAHGGNCAPIPGAAASRAHAAASSITYKLTSVDLGHALRVRQTQTNGLGSASLESAPTPAVVPSRGHCSNLFAGTAKRDRLRGTGRSDRLSGGRGNDRLSGLGGGDCISGGKGNDTLSGGKGNDTLSGGPGRDRITAGPGRNKVIAGSGNDTINVRNHKRDRVDCGKGRDRVRADRLDRLRHCELVKRRR